MPVSTSCSSPGKILSNNWFTYSRREELKRKVRREGAALPLSAMYDGGEIKVLGQDGPPYFPRPYNDLPISSGRGEKFIDPSHVMTEAPQEANCRGRNM